MSDFEHELVNILDEAIQRVESGETLDSILADFPAEYRDELRKLLEVVSSDEHIAAEPVPLPSIERRKKAKQDFLAFAREMMQHDEKQSSVHDSASVSSSDALLLPTLLSSEDTGQENWFKRLGVAFENLFQIPAQRLAPIAALLLLGIMSLASFFTVAGAVPGDLAYGFKEWARRVEVDLAYPEDLPAIVSAQNEDRKEELEVAQERADRSALNQADLNDSVLMATMRTIYRGQGMGDLLITDATNVLPRFQPDANDSDRFTEMAVLGYLEPGVEIEIEYQIVPGGQDYVQGIQATTIKVPPVEIPTPVITDAVSSTAPLSPCIVSPGGGWETYRIQTGDSLSSIAAARGTSASDLADRNCIANQNLLVHGSEIFVPPGQIVLVDPTATIPPTPTKSTVFVSPIQTPSMDEIVSEEVDKLREGTIGFTPPEEMIAGIPETILASISKQVSAEAEEEIIASITERSQDAGFENVPVTKIRDIDVSSQMRIELNANPDDFEITALHESAEQPLGEEELAHWQWNVMPLRAGLNKKLELSVDAIIVVRYPNSDEFSEEKKFIKTLTETIVVKVNPIYTAKVIWKNSWQWLTTAFLLLVAAWLAYRPGMMPIVKGSFIRRNPKYKGLKDALLDAYSRDKLSQMVKVELDQDLDVIAGGKDLDDIVWNLIMWAERLSAVKELVEAAYRGNPSNLRLKVAVKDFLGKLPEVS
ncbi:MAG: effector-associated domain EAD1-containing protein [Chloroflexota bacterium]